jgi:hypothetical protein
MVACRRDDGEELGARHALERLGMDRRNEVRAHKTDANGFHVMFLIAG